MATDLEWTSRGEIPKWKGKPVPIELNKPTGIRKALPRTKREADYLGWTETEWGWLCPSCTLAAKEQEWIDQEEFASGGIGLDSMAEGMVQAVNGGEHE